MGPDRGRRLSTDAFAIGVAYEASLSDAARRAGAHYTPSEVACGLVRLTLETWWSGADRPRRVPRCLDLSCGGGVFLVALADELAAAGASPVDIVERHLAGVDLDPGAVAATTAALRRWAADHGVADVTPDVIVGDGLAVTVGDGLADRPGAAGFDVVVGNPPFQSQLDARTARRDSERRALRARYGEAAGGYVDTAALFLLAARDRLGPGGVMCLIQPRATLSSSHVAGVREELAATVRLVASWEPGERVFDAAVDVWAPVFLVGEESPRSTEVRLVGGRTAEREVGSIAEVGPEWSLLSGGARDLPDLSGWSVDGVLSDLAWATAGFRDEYYAVLAHTSDDPPPGPAMRAVTSGSIEPGSCSWGDRPIRFGKRSWQHPWVDLDRLAEDSPRVAGWAWRLRVPKVVVATQTRVVECVTDAVGDLLPLTPTIAVVPNDPRDLDRVAAILSSPPVSVWARRRRAGSGLSAATIRLAARDLLEVPLPAAAGLSDLPAPTPGRDPDRAWATRTTEAYGVEGRAAQDLVDWWLGNRPAPDCM